MRYIIGLIPLNSTAYIKVAQELFIDVSDGYLLSEMIFPHITVAQFESNDLNLVETIWEEIKKLEIKPFKPKLIGINFKKGFKEHTGFYWVQISAERDPLVMKMHYQILDLLERHQLNCLVDAGDIYKPHITLARIRLQKPIPQWPENILESENFRLTLGTSDQNGRYLKMIGE